MVREGLAWAFTRFSVDYVGQQEEARTAIVALRDYQTRKGSS
jgi:hypothetical protein